MIIYLLSCVVIGLFMERCGGELEIELFNLFEVYYCFGGVVFDNLRDCLWG